MWSGGTRASWQTRAAMGAQQVRRARQPPASPSGVPSLACSSSARRRLAPTTPHAAPAADGEPVALREGRITLYVEHPVFIEPPAEAPPPPPQPLKLTKRELKKMRTQVLASAAAGSACGTLFSCACGAGAGPPSTAPPPPPACTCPAAAASAREGEAGAHPAGPAGAAAAQGQDQQPDARAGRGGHRRCPPSRRAQGEQFSAAVRQCGRAAALVMSPPAPPARRPHRRGGGGSQADGRAPGSARRPQPRAQADARGAQVGGAACCASARLCSSPCRALLLSRARRPTLRRDKKMTKLLGNSEEATETHVAVYKARAAPAGAGTLPAVAGGLGQPFFAAVAGRPTEPPPLPAPAALPARPAPARPQVGDLSNPQLRFKVDVNAKENHMTGTAITGGDFCLVVVEGQPKTLRRRVGRGAAGAQAPARRRARRAWGVVCGRGLRRSRCARCTPAADTRSSCSDASTGTRGGRRRRRRRKETRRSRPTTAI